MIRFPCGVYVNTSSTILSIPWDDKFLEWGETVYHGQCDMAQVHFPLYVITFISAKEAFSFRFHFLQVFPNSQGPVLVSVYSVFKLVIAVSTSVLSFDMLKIINSFLDLI